MVDDEVLDRVREPALKHRYVSSRMSGTESGPSNPSKLLLCRPILRRDTLKVHDDEYDEAPPDGRPCGAGLCDPKELRVEAGGSRASDVAARAPFFLDESDEQIGSIVLHASNKESQVNNLGRSTVNGLLSRIARKVLLFCNTATNNLEKPFLMFITVEFTCHRIVTNNA